jgi:1,4-dihydroxy-2-naphthoate octaprenyltransferase
MHHHVFLRSARPAFLVLTPACVALGAATALASSHDISLWHLFWLLIGSLSAHLAVNWLNEYYDCKSGLDLHTQKTPFNGGSGALQERPELALWVLGLGLSALVITVIIGIYFVYVAGFVLLLMGISGVLLIITYTEWINRMPRVCLLAPGAGFGLLMVGGIHIVLAGNITGCAVIASGTVFCLVNALLLINQLPDMQADKAVGRLHFTMVYGMHKTLQVYVAFIVMVAVLIVLAVALGVMPYLALLAMLPLPLMMYTAQGLKKFGATIGQHPPYMAANVSAVVLTPLLLAIALLIAC